MPMQGTVIGTYRILDKLGEGGMGAVYVAEHTLLGRKAALKVLLPSLSANQEVVRRFFNEARAVGLIADPGIVQIFDFGYHSDGSAFIVMELLEGEPMDKRLQRIGRFGLLDGLRLLRLICVSLGAAHAKGIVHRDLKPENIYLVHDPGVVGGERPKILDFGIAKLSSDDLGVVKTRTGMLMGTPVYMSPEQCRGAGDVDHRSDIYALGCVMFMMLTGRPPFDGQASGELIASHLREPPPLAASIVPGMPAVIDEILQICLRKSPADRFPSMEHLARALERAEQVLQVGNAAPPGRANTPAGLYAPAGATPWSAGQTTLSAATGQAAAAPAARGPASARSRRVLGAAAAIAVAGGALAIAVTRGRDTPTPTTEPAFTGRASAAAPREASPRPEAPPRPEVPPPAAPSPAAQPPAPPAAAAVAAGDAHAVPPDAGVPDAAPASKASDPAPAVPHRKRVDKSPRQANPGGDHANPTGSAAPPRIDRGD